MGLSPWAAPRAPRPHRRNLPVKRWYLARRWAKRSGVWASTAASYWAKLPSNQLTRPSPSITNRCVQMRSRKKTVVADHQRGPGELDHRLLQYPHRGHVEVVGGFVQQQQIARRGGAFWPGGMRFRSPPEHSPTRFCCWALRKLNRAT